MSNPILKKLKPLDKFWHPESTLVFKSKDEKVVIGRYKNDEFFNIDDTCKKLCKKWKFKPCDEENDIENNEDEVEVESDVENDIDKETEHEDQSEVENDDDESDVENVVNEEEIDHEIETHCELSIRNVIEKFTHELLHYNDHVHKKFTEEITLLKNEISKTINERDSYIETVKNIQTAYKDLHNFCCTFTREINNQKNRLD